ncbi:hypothetical protein [Emticicia sp. W12TSBA100-4]|uniref:hypothetical protein n=1 Tax=Emticicia sp. W12TSBA100-4 TaxID=3160965 RepID=UPI003305EF7C
MKVNFKMLTIGVLLVALASFLYFLDSDSISSQATPAIDSVVILKDSISKLQNLNSILQHEKTEIARQRDLLNNRNTSLLENMRAINSDLSRQPKHSDRVRK